jgi:membrane protein implicated in regulation of membrane protease activity
MGWIVFEAVLALAGLLALVWWTFRSRREEPPEPPRDDDA